MRFFKKPATPDTPEGESAETPRANADGPRTPDPGEPGTARPDEAGTPPPGELRTPPPAEPAASPPDINVALATVVDSVEGVLAAALVDYETGGLLATADRGDLDLETASAGHLDVFRAERDLLTVLGIEDRLEDILITLRTQYHLLRPVEAELPLLLCIVVDRSRANLGLARHHLRSVETKLGLAVAG